jgi:phage FluMu protein Com
MTTIYPGMFTDKKRKNGEDTALAKLSKEHFKNTGIKCHKCQKLIVYYDAYNRLFCPNCKSYVNESESHESHVVERGQQPSFKIPQWISSLKKEQIVLLITAVVLFIMFLLPPYHIVIKGTGGRELIINEGYGFLFVPPVDKIYDNYTSTVNIPLLALQFLMVTTIGVLLYFVFKEKYK